MKKNIYVVLPICLTAAIFLFLVFAASCAGDTAGNALEPAGGTNPADKPPVEIEAGDPFDPGLPEADYGGYEFRILNIDEDTLWWAIAEVDVFEQSGEVVNDAIYARNRNVEDRYNFTLREIRMGEAALNAAIKNSVNSGADEYDLVLPLTTGAPTHAQNRHLVDLYKVPNLNFEKPWWSSSISKNFSVNNRLFFTYSNLILSPDEDAGVMMYNKNISESLGIDSADSLYKLVVEGKWTFDKFAQLCKSASSDLNGNGKIDPLEDRFGIITVDWLYQALLGGFGETLVSKDSDDRPYLSCKSERFLSCYIKMTEFMLQRDVVLREYLDFNGPTDMIFINDKALFCCEVLGCVRLFRDMGSDFGVLPFPKFDELQERYYTYTLISTCIGIPVTNTNLDRTGVILESLGAESRRLVIPAYYDVALGLKYLRDEGSIRMLDIILEGKIYDICNSQVMYNWGGFSTAVLNLSKKGDTNFAAVLEKYEDKTNADIQKTIDAYDSID